MNTPLFTELSDAHKVALLIRLAERYCERGCVPETMRRAEIDEAIGGTPAEQIKKLEGVVAFFSGWADLSIEDVATDLNDPDFVLREGGAGTLSENDMDKVADIYLSAHKPAPGWKPETNGHGTAASFYPTETPT